MADSKAISIRLPDELLAKVNKLAEEKYKSIAGKPNKSLVVQNALIAYFDTLSDSVSGERIVTENDTVSIADFKELQDFVAILSRDIKQLKEEKITLQDTAIKPQSIESRENSTPLQLTAFTASDTVTELRITVDLLAKRIGSKNPKSIQNKKSSSSDVEFSEWTAKKDLDGIPWLPMKIGKFVYFTPAIDLPDELRGKLAEWIKESNIVE
jgi:predicted DNA-binding protein